MKQLSKDMQIDQFITNKLEDAELWEFRHQMEADPDLAREVAFRQEIYEALSDRQKLDFRQKVMALKPVRTTHFSLHNHRWQAIAAGLVILIMAGATLFTSLWRNDSHKDLFQQYYQPESSLLTVRSGNLDNTTLSLAMVSYDQGQYHESIDMFNTIPDNVLARLYSGLAYMNIKEYDKAIEQFQWVTENGDNLFIDQADWYLGLSYLANNKTSKAKRILQVISTSGSAYNEQAAALLKELENK